MRGVFHAALAAIFLAVMASADATAQSGPPQDRYIVVLKDGGQPPGDVASDIAIRTNGAVGYVYETALRGFSITMPRAALNGLRQDPRVAYVEEDIPVSAVAQVLPTGVERMFPDTTALDIDGQDDYRVDADVAVLDTGIDRQHSDLNVAGGTNCMNHTGGAPWRRSYYCDGSDGDDDHYHGTHVAGTIAALDNGIGVVGVAPGARLWAVKVLDQNGSGSLSGIAAGIDWVVAQGTIEVINMSLSGNGQSDVMDEAIAAAVDSGVTVVVAASNDDDNAAYYTPANSPGAITVSALADFDGLAGALGAPTCRIDQDDSLADFSNWGAVDIAAPGVCIFSTFPIEKGEYGTISGTSMAAPHTAGAAALLASKGHGPDTIRNTLLTSGNYNWTDDSGDGTQEPLLDISTSSFDPVLIATSAEGGNLAPTASFGYGCDGLTCNFVDGSSDDDGTIQSWTWDFGDGNGSSEQNPQHSYAAGGTYTVELTVSDDDGASDSTSQPVSVSSGDSGPADACDGLADGVHLSATSTNEGRTWTAIVDALNCQAGDVSNFSSVDLSWSPLVGSTNDDCSTSTGACQATQSGIRKFEASVDFTLNGTTITVAKP